MTLHIYTIPLSSDLSNLIEDALELHGEVKFTKNNPVMKIPIKGKIILKFGHGENENRILELECFSSD